MIVYQIACLIVLAVCSLVTVRNALVLRYRTNLLDKVSTLAESDADGDWEWRFETLESVSYDEMVLKFWKPLDSFYPDKSFIE